MTTIFGSIGSVFCFFTTSKFREATVLLASSTETEELTAAAVFGVADEQ